MVTNIDRNQLISLLEDGAVVLDVLPEREHRAQHIPGAISAPLKTLTPESLASLRRDKPVVVY